MVIKASVLLLNRSRSRDEEMRRLPISLTPISSTHVFFMKTSI